jgi:N-acetylhexosamine 1-kinase
MEVETLALSSFALTVELAVRFLDDYIQGSPYFKINYPEHNLVRARNQIALAKDMQKKLPQMEQIVKDCVAAIR